MACPVAKGSTKLTTANVSSVHHKNWRQRESHLELDHVHKAFGSVQAVVDGNLSIDRGEIISVLGPSGCGKSTLLNLIAGFEAPDSGEIRLNGVRVNETPANRRPTALVFQNYALFPHMTVWDNVTYGLRVRGQKSDAISVRTRECLSLLKLEGLDHRYPAELSGGQKQRVAVARALAVRPEILLLDEALSALDKNLREEMQIELSLLLRRLSITTILVTHDQREAFALGDRIVIMESGQILQTGPPSEVYDLPSTPFVLGFLGRVNYLPVSLRRHDEFVEVCATAGPKFRCPSSRVLTAANTGVLCIRSEDVVVATTPTDVHPDTPGVLRLGSFLGPTQRYVVDLSGHELVLESAAMRAFRNLAAGENVFVDFSPERCFIKNPD